MGGDPVPGILNPDPTGKWNRETELRITIRGMKSVESSIRRERLRLEKELKSLVESQSKIM